MTKIGGYIDAATFLAFSLKAAFLYPQIARDGKPSQVSGFDDTFQNLHIRRQIWTAKKILSGRLDFWNS